MSSTPVWKLLARRAWTGHLGPVQHICKLGPDIERHAFADTEGPAEIEVLDWPTLLAVVVVVRSGGSPLAGKWIAPREWIQNEILVRVDAVAIQILGE